MSSAASTIYSGFWINWSYGKVNGSTLTLTSENSAFLIAFIALFVRFAGGQLWTVLAFLASVTRSTAEPQDAFYHQQQSILRNTSQPTSVLWAMLKLSWFWKGTARKAWARTFAFITTTLAYMAAFAVAGIFSSRISSVNSEVLLRSSPNCGFWRYPFIRFWDPAKDTFQEYEVRRSQYWSNYNQILRKSHSYVSECYNSTVDNREENCLPLGKSRIAWSTTPDVPCPFDKDLCITNAIQFDTGFLSSHTHFGINAKEDRIEYRRVMTCAPITTDGYVSGYVNADDLNTTESGDAVTGSFQNEKYLRYSYGQSILFNDNTTYAFSDESFSYSKGYWTTINSYSLDAEFSAAAPENMDTLSGSTFSAIPSLARPDYDTTLVFLSHNGSYLTEVRDPWFRSSQWVNATSTSSDGEIFPMSYYNSDAPVTVVACAEQHQLRNSRNGVTSRLGGQETTTNAQAEELGFNDNQLAIFNRSFVLASLSVVSLLAPGLGGTYLLATNNEFFAMSPGLPDNQWQFEFEHWFGVSLIAMQLWSQQYVSGPFLSQAVQYLVPARDGFEKESCANQIIRRADYRSFSVLGMSLIFAFGVLFIIANLTIGPIVQLVQERTQKGRYRNAEWQANDFLQLQRMAYQHKDIGHWTGQRDMVPRTQPGKTFTLPDSMSWDEESLERRNKERGDRFPSLAQAWSHEATHSQTRIGDISRSSMDDRPVITTIDLEKMLKLSEVELKK